MSDDLKMVPPGMAQLMAQTRALMRVVSLLVNELPETNKRKIIQDITARAAHANNVNIAQPPGLGMTEEVSHQLNVTYRKILALIDGSPEPPTEMTAE